MARAANWEDCRTETCKNKVKSLNDFKNSMLDFPCTFNLVLPNLTPDLTVTSKASGLTEPYLAKHNCRRLKHELRDESDDEDFEEAVWKKNFLTRILYELDGDVMKATKLNQKIMRLETNSNNLTALANSAFLHFHNQEIKKAMEVLKKLRELKQADAAVFKGLKVQALIEQAYAFRKLGGSSNLLCAIQLLTTVTDFVPEDEKVKFMLALVYRRCTSMMLYTENSERIDRKKHALEAANRLHELGTTAKDKSIRAAAIAELAFLRKGDKIKELRLIESPLWEDLIGTQSWKKLCYRALAVDKENPNDRVLKMVGQMFKTDEKCWGEAIGLLQKSIKIRPSSRAHHHLGLLFVKKSVAYEKNKFRRQNFETRRAIQFSSDTPEKHIRKDTFKNIEERLSFNIKVPREKLPPFSEDNPYIANAETNLRASVAISFNISITAQYDLALFLARRCQYDEARSICQKAIDIFSESPFGFIKRLHLVNVYNLYGMCCSLEAEETKDKETKALLVKRNEEYLWLAIKMATEIAASVPELKECATDLWKIFDQLQKSFRSRGDPHSQLKLYDFVGNYSFPIKLEEILSIELPDWKRKESLEIYIKKYTKEKDFESADFLLKLIKLRSGSCDLTMQNSKIVRQLRFEQAAMALDKNNPKSEEFPDQIWMTIIDELICAKQISPDSKSPDAKSPDSKSPDSKSPDSKSLDSKSPDSKIPDSKKAMDFDVLFMADSCSEGEDGLWSYRASLCLTRVFNKTCGLSVDNVDLIKIPGGLALGQETSAFFRTKVLVVLLDGSVDVHAFSRTEDDHEVRLDQAIEKLDQLSLTSQNSADRNGYESAGSPVPNLQEIKHSPVKGGEGSPKQQQPLCSDRFKYLITLAVESNLSDGAPRHIITAVENDRDKLLVPHEARGFPVLVLSDEDISVLDDADCKDKMRQNELIMNTFKLLVNADKKTDQVSSP